MNIFMWKSVDCLFSVLEKEEDEEYIYKYSSELRVIRNIDRKKIKR